jgi:hypothetical protein
MLDLEQRLREDVTQEARAFDPSSDLPARVDRRIRQRTRRNRIAAAAAVAVVGVAIGAGSLVATGGEQTGRTETVDQPVETTVPEPDTTVPPVETTVPDPETDGPESTTATTAAPPVDTTVPGADEEEPTPAIGPGTPLSRQGVGPIRFGMTIREAEVAVGAPITVGFPEGVRCGDAQFDGIDGVHLAFRVERADAAEDPKDAIIRSVSGGPSTVEGIAVGDPAEDVIAVYGEPTQAFNSGEEGVSSASWIFESGGFAYSVYTDGIEVLSLGSGEAGWITTFDPCA